MKIRNVLKEYEAHLKPLQPGGSLQGKSEWKQYGDGTYRFRVTVRKIALPDNSRVDVLVDNTRIATLKVTNEKVKLDTEVDKGIGLPNVQTGLKLQIVSGGSVLAEGQFIEE